MSGKQSTLPVVDLCTPTRSDMHGSHMALVPGTLSKLVCLLVPTLLGIIFFTVISPSVTLTGQTCLSLCMLPVHVEQHTCFVGLVTWLLHQLSLAADQSCRGALMHVSLSWSQALNCLAVLTLAFLHIHLNFLELWPPSYRAD